MKRAGPWVVTLGCLLALVLACFGRVLFQDQQFSFRDAGEYYYPLHQRVQSEWMAGRWPLWEPGENGGVPLLANATAAVFYPGKLVFAIGLPYAWSARAYILIHVLLACATMFIMLRAWGVSHVGASLGSLSYGFGAPVLFQYCNVVYLVGAAWLPLGLLAADRLATVPGGRPLALLAVALSLQVLGGDPEAAYLVIGCGVLRAADRSRASRGFTWKLWAGLCLVAVGWIAFSLWAASLAWRGQWGAAGPLTILTRPWLIMVAWLLVGALLAILQSTRPFMRRLSWMAGGAVLALCLSAVQAAPSLELSRLSTRATAGGQHDANPFSVEPVRALELVWPGFFGPVKAGERHWLSFVPPGHETQLWVASLYVGGLTLALAAAGFGFRGGPPWRGWISILLILSALGAMGQFGSPIWWARAFPSVHDAIGPHDPPLAGPARGDGGVSDGFGSVYWLMAQALPGFGLFRYPGKLLVFTSAALSALAGLGWDRWRQGSGRRLPWILLGLSLAGLLAVSLNRQRLTALVLDEHGRLPETIFGPFDPEGAAWSAEVSLAHGALMMGCSLALAAAARRGRSWAGSGALILMAVDLAVANADMIITAPQSLFDREPAIARLIANAEARDPSPGPFRIHRMPQWFPSGWQASRSGDRFLQATQWEYDTLKPKFGLARGLSYAQSGGAIELFDVNLFFGSFLAPYDPGRFKLPGAQPGQPVLAYTRRGFDMWTARYFIVPAEPGSWLDAARGCASFLEDATVIAPRGPRASREWALAQDWRLLRNDKALPRAWAVHQARFTRPLDHAPIAERAALMQEILYDDGPFWRDPERFARDPLAVAWVETDDPESLAPFIPNTPPDADESTAITCYEPQRVEIEARLNRPGVVVLADVHYPGWNLAIDGRPAPLLRVNRLMRGAAVASGRHQLVYTFDPLSFRLGGYVSLIGLLAVTALAAWPRRRIPDDAPQARAGR